MARTVRQLDLIVETVIYLQTEGRRLAREQCQALGVTATQLNVLKLLDEIDTLSLSELSRRLAAQNSTITGIVDRMVQAGLVAREQSAEDRRVWKIRATEHGRALAARADNAPWELLRRALASLDRKEKETLVTILDKVARKIRTHVEGEVK
ncbi:MAG: MarR family transcriptional regulator [Myxococcales bacterium]|nr:MarR family transcriptional regulator [Myxococcales bacterium]